MITEIAVVVPAADEEERIGACLAAIWTACAAVGPDVRTRVIVVLDDCRDGTASVVARDGTVETIRSDARCVGAARALGAAHAIATAADPDGLWLANTDADSLVPAYWLNTMLASNVDLVLGTVLPGPELSAAQRALWTQRHEPGDGHRHVHGANLGISAAALRSIGNWGPLVTGEDADLVARAELAGLRILRTGAIPVITSARAVGRAPRGFSSYLRELA